VAGLLFRDGQWFNPQTSPLAYAAQAASRGGVNRHRRVPMNPFDIITTVILGYSSIRGLFRGLVKELSSVVGVLGGFYAAYSYYPTVSELTSGFISDSAYRNIFGFFVIFCAVFVIISIVGVIIKYLLNVAFLGWVDRIGGVMFGVVKGILIVSVLFIALTAFLPKGAPLIKRSHMAPHALWLSENMARAVPQDLKRQFWDKLQDLKKTWKKPN
jgi:membrane protein required for colicin V production